MPPSFPLHKKSIPSRLESALPPLPPQDGSLTPAPVLRGNEQGNEQSDEPGRTLAEAEFGVEWRHADGRDVNGEVVNGQVVNGEDPVTRYLPLFEHLELPLSQKQQLILDLYALLDHAFDLCLAPNHADSAPASDSKLGEQ
jgi:hypothetical protein